MAASPVLPAEFKAEISDPTATMCTNFINTLLKLPVSLYKFIAWLLDSSGNFTKGAFNQSQRTGTIIMSACLQTEDVMLLCDGREIDRTTYADLFAAIGLTYGTPSGGSVFKIPDYRAKFPVGIGTFAGAETAALGVSGGEDKHLLTPTEQGSIQVTAAADDGDDRTGVRVSIETLTINGTTFGDAGSLGVQGPTTIRLKNDAAAHLILPPFLPAYIYIAL